MELKYLTEKDFLEWDKFVESSPQGTIFSTSIWLKAINYCFKILCLYQDNKPVGGIAFFTDKKNIIIPPLTRFQGILLKKNLKRREENKITSAIVEKLTADFNNISISNHYNLKDIRPFIWAGFSVEVKYTYLVDISDLEELWQNMEKRTRYAIRKAERNKIVVKKEDKIAEFDRLHQFSLLNQKRKRPFNSSFLKNFYSTLKKFNKCQLYLAERKNGDLSAGAFVVWDKKRAYYLMAGADPKFRGDESPSLILWTIFSDFNKKGFKEIDLVGANIPSIEKFKRGFGGKLIHYFNVKK